MSSSRRIVEILQENCCNILGISEVTSHNLSNILSLYFFELLLELLYKYKCPTWSGVLSVISLSGLLSYIPFQSKQNTIWDLTHRCKPYWLDHVNQSCSFHFFLCYFVICFAILAIPQMKYLLIKELSMVYGKKYCWSIAVSNGFLNIKNDFLS